MVVNTNQRMLRRVFAEAMSQAFQLFGAQITPFFPGYRRIQKYQLPVIERYGTVPP